MHVSRCLAALALAAALGCGGPHPPKPPEQGAVFKTRMAQSLFNAGRVTEALEQMREAVALEPSNPALHLQYGQFCFRSGRNAEAERAFLEALRLDPYFTDARNYLGAVYQEQGRLPEAETEYRRALDNHAYPTPELIYLNLGLLYADQARSEEAIDMLRRAVEINPKFYRAHFELASQLERIGKFDEAAREYEVAAPDYRTVGEYFYRLGLNYFRLGERERARDNLSRVLVVAPGSESAAQADELLKVLN